MRKCGFFNLNARGGAEAIGLKNPQFQVVSVTKTLLNQ